MFSSLTALDRDFQPVPDLAEDGLQVVALQPFHVPHLEPVEHGRTVLVAVSSTEASRSLRVVALGANRNVDELRELWEEMTMVRRSQPAGTSW